MQMLINNYTAGVLVLKISYTVGKTKLLHISPLPWALRFPHRGVHWRCGYFNSPWAQTSHIANRSLYGHLQPRRTIRLTVILRYTIILHCTGRGGGGNDQSFIWGGSNPRSNPLFFHITFFTENSHLLFTFS